jgi:phage portal protein BeeE
MNPFKYIVKMYQGRIDKRTSRVLKWQNLTIDYTSNFVQSIHSKIINDLIVMNFKHVRAEINSEGPDFFEELTASDVSEVLNNSANGERNNFEFWFKVYNALLMSGQVYLDPKYKKTKLVSLERVDFWNDTTINFISPFISTVDKTLLDEALSGIGEKLSSKKLRGYLKINANLQAGTEKFKQETLEQLKTMQEIGQYNGLGVLDGKAELIELQKDYAVITKDEINLIKSEILETYGIPESILNGTYTKDEYKNYYKNVLMPIISQVEKEVNLKLLTSENRIRGDDKNKYEYITFTKSVLEFASIEELTKLIEANVNSPIFMQNEIRDMVDYSPVSGGDKFYTNLNSVVLDKRKENTS